MPKRSKEDWLALFQQHDESGLPASQFCQQNNLCPKYFSLRKKQLSWGSPTFIKVKAPTPLSIKPAAVNAITLSVGDCTLQLPLSISETWLAKMVKALNA